MEGKYILYFLVLILVLNIIIIISVVVYDRCSVFRISAVILLNAFTTKYIDERNYLCSLSRIGIV